MRYEEMCVWMFDDYVRPYLHKIVDENKELFLDL